MTTLQSYGTPAPRAPVRTRRIPLTLFVFFFLVYCLAFQNEAQAQEMTSSAPAMSVQKAERTTPKNKETRAPSAITVSGVLNQFAEAQRRRRYVESSTGLITAGALAGIGWALNPRHEQASHWIWGAAGLATLGSVAGYFVPSELETLREDTRGQSDEAVRRAWAKLARRTRTARHIGGIVLAAVGVGAGITGGIVLDDHKALGTTLLAAGGLGVGGGITTYLLPTQLEQGYTLVSGTSELQLSFAASPVPGGLLAGLQGSF